LKKYRDDICRIGPCPNVGVCLGLCPLVKHTDGNSRSKEVLLSNLVNPDNIEFRDYKSTISEMAEDQITRQEAIFERLVELTENMEQTSFYHRRKIAISILLDLHFKKHDIAKMLRMSIWRLYQILQ
jgi:hypothetical protein